PGAGDGTTGVAGGSGRPGRGRTSRPAQEGPHLGRGGRVALSRTSGATPPGRCDDGVMDLGLAGRGYVVTGGSRGLGRAAAAHLTADGADVLLVGRDADRARRTAEELTADGPGTAYALAADLADEETPELVLAGALEHLDTLDGAVLSVGGPTPGRFRE